MLIKLLGARFGGAGTTGAGAAVVEAFARSQGSGVHAVDGSGLTRANRASPAPGRQPAAGDARASPSAKTSSRTWPSPARKAPSPTACTAPPPHGRCRIKTGTLTGVSNLSGYCFNRSGRTMVFSILMNGVGDLGLAHLEQDRIAAAVAELLNAASRRPVFVEDLGPELLGLGQLRAGFSPATT